MTANNLLLLARKALEEGKTAAAEEHYAQVVNSMPEASLQERKFAAAAITSLQYLRDECADLDLQEKWAYLETAKGHFKAPAQLVAESFWSRGVAELVASKTPQEESTDL